MTRRKRFKAAVTIKDVRRLIADARRRAKALRVQFERQADARVKHRGGFAFTDMEDGCIKVLECLEVELRSNPCARCSGVGQVRIHGDYKTCQKCQGRGSEMRKNRAQS